MNEKQIPAKDQARISKIADRISKVYALNPPNETGAIMASSWPLYQSYHEMSGIVKFCIQMNFDLAWLMERLCNE